MNITKKTERGSEETSHIYNSTSHRQAQVVTVLKHMENYGSITSMTAFEKYGITRLSGRIHDLRKRGYDIDCLWETSPAGKRYGRYVLRKESA